MTMSWGKKKGGKGKQNESQFERHWLKTTKKCKNEET